MNKVISIIALVIALATLALTVFSMQQSRIGYVRISYLLEHYQGMKEAKNTYQLQVNDWANLIDSLSKDLDYHVNIYKSRQANLSKDSNEIWMAYLENKKTHIDELSSKLGNVAQQEDEKQSQQVLDRVNGFIQRYGEKEGYTFIFGATMAGSILYGEHTHDVTLDILEELNKEYTKGYEK